MSDLNSGREMSAGGLVPNGTGQHRQSMPAAASDSVQYACPACLEALRTCASGMECSLCKCSFPEVAGIPIFSKQTNSRYSTMAREDLSRIHGMVQQLGWQRGVAAFLETLPTDQADFWATYILSELSAAGKLLMHLEPAAKVLDLGCGTGTFSINLAPQVEQVTALDLGLTQLQLLQYRIEEAGIQNLRLVCAGDRRYLPFPNASFDVVLLNGVLKWIARDQPGNPRDLQINLLAEINRVLKPSGMLYMATDNRFSHEYFSGHPEEHTKLRFVTLLPRTLAQLLSRWKIGTPYRSYTYSRWGYRRLLSKAGFSKSHIYVSHPNYRVIEHLSDGEHRIHPSKNLFVKTRLKAQHHRHWKARLMPYLAHSYSIVAAKSALTPGFVEQAIEQLRQWRASEEGTAPRLELTDLLISETGAGVVFASDHAAGRDFVMKTPITLEARERLNQGFENLRAVRRAIPRSSPFLSSIPEPFAKLECHGQPLYVESHCSGSDLKYCHRSYIDRQGLYRLGLDFLIGLHRETSGEQRRAPVCWNTWLALREEYLNQVIPAGSRENWNKLLLRVKSFLQKTPPAPVWMHGDLWPGNLVANEQGDRLTGVVDWSYADASGLPLTDLLQLVLVTKGQAANRSFSQMLGARMTAGKFHNDEQGFIDEYCAKFSIPAGSIWDLSALAWIDWIYRRYPIRGSLVSWRRSEIEGFLDVVGKDLT